MRKPTIRGTGTCKARNQGSVNLVVPCLQKPKGMLKTSTASATSNSETVKCEFILPSHPCNYADQQVDRNGGYACMISLIHPRTPRGNLKLTGTSSCPVFILKLQEYFHAVLEYLRDRQMVGAFFPTGNRVLRDQKELLWAEAFYLCFDNQNSWNLNALLTGQLFSCLEALLCNAFIKHRNESARLL
jgi:hypothetical protein